jgi:pyruvate, water dikinase
MLTLTFDDPRCTDNKLVGGKAHGLATMTQAGIPVSPGFTVTTTAYRAYLDATGMRQRIDALLESVDRASIDALDEMARTIEGWFDYTPLPDELLAAVGDGYRMLCESLDTADLSVAVRSSATAEDSAGASFAGEYETFVGMRGQAEIELHLRRCWASAFSARALSYAWKNGISPMAVDMAVVIQKTVNARAAGVMFTVSPLTGDRSRLVIEACYGLGLGVVGGDVSPDRYVVAKIEGHIVERIIGDKHIEYIRGQKATPVEHDRRVQLCLTDTEVLALAQVGKRLERLQRAPQDIEFAIDRELPAGQNIVLLQCRPVTVFPPRHSAAGASDEALAQLASNVLAAAKTS